MSGKRSGIIYIVIGTIILCGAFTAYWNTQTASSKHIITILIDPGHGGDDPGKIGINGELEKDINLSISRKLAACLKANGYHVVMSRETDCMLSDPQVPNKKTSDLSRRVQMMQESEADFVISIHQNSYPDNSIHGAQCFYYAGSDTGQELAGILQAALISLADPDNRRQAKSNDSYYIMKNSTCPVIIVECGFLSNADEALLLSDDQYQEKLALAITTGINQYVQTQSLYDRKIIFQHSHIIIS